MKKAKSNKLYVHRLFVKASTNVDQQLLQMIDSIMQLQQNMIDIGDHFNRETRLQLFFVFLRVGIAMTFNAYNLALFGANLANGNNKMNMSVVKSVIFYGYHILSHALEFLITIISFSRTYDSLAATVRIVNKLNITTNNEELRAKFTQFSLLVQMNLRPYTIFGLYPLNATLIYAFVSGMATYIIILLQYGLENELDAEFVASSVNNNKNDAF